MLTWCWRLDCTVTYRLWSGQKCSSKNSKLQIYSIPLLSRITNSHHPVLWTWNTLQIVRISKIGKVTSGTKVKLLEPSSNIILLVLSSVIVSSSMWANTHSFHLQSVTAVVLAIHVILSKRFRAFNFLQTSKQSFDDLFITQTSVCKPMRVKSCGPSAIAICHVAYLMHFTLWQLTFIV